MSVTVRTTHELAGGRAVSHRRVVRAGAGGPVEAFVTTAGPAGGAGLGSEGDAPDGAAAPDVVFLHGLVGLNEHWEMVTERVCGRVRCTMLELPLLDLVGADCSVDGVTRLTEGFLERCFGGRPVVLVGNSFGGHVAVKTALSRPELVRGLVLAGASGLYEKSLMHRPPHNPSRAWIRAKIAELFFEEESLREEDVDRAHAALTKRSGAKAMIKLSRSARRDHLGDRLRELSTPTLLLWGNQDVVTPPSSGRAFAEMIPDSRVVWLERCGHVPMVEAAEQFAEALVAFVEELASGAVGGEAAAGSARGGSASR